MIDIRHGRWQEALADVTECDVVLEDPPYSEKTHRGYCGRRDGADFDGD